MVRVFAVAQPIIANSAARFSREAHPCIYWPKIGPMMNASELISDDEAAI